MVVLNGHGTRMYPSADERRVVARFGGALASDLLPVVRCLERCFWQSDANLVANGIQEMGRLAIADFRRRYPRVPTNALDAFSSSYTFNNR